MNKLNSFLLSTILISTSAFASECSLYSNSSLVKTPQSNIVHIPKSELSPEIIDSAEFKKHCDGENYCSTGDAFYTAFKLKVGSSTLNSTGVNGIEFVGQEYKTEKKDETFIDVYELLGVFGISNDLMVCGHKDPILYVKLPVSPTRMALFKDLIDPNGIFSRNRNSEFEKIVIQDI